MVHEIILINIWKDKIFPQLLKLEPHPEITYVIYTILIHEEMCSLLLQVTLSHPGSSEAVKDVVDDLLDYAYETTSQLLVVKLEEPQEEENVERELCRRRNNLSFDIGIRSLFFIGYVTEYCDRYVDV